jgi:hypothetical protein
MAINGSDVTGMRPFVNTKVITIGPEQTSKNFAQSILKFSLYNPMTESENTIVKTDKGISSLLGGAKTTLTTLIIENIATVLKPVSRNSTSTCLEFLVSGFK